MVKKIELSNGVILLDGFSHLLIFTSQFLNYVKENKGTFTYSNTLKYLRNGYPCKIEMFVTKKGRNAIKIDLGNTHVIKLIYGHGDINWKNWEKRRPVNASYAEAIRNSKGGGCWVEVIIMESGTEPISAEQADYMEDLGILQNNE